MLLPIWPFKCQRGFKIRREVMLFSEGKVACDNLVEGEDGHFDVVAAFLVSELEVLIFVTFPANLGTHIEVEDLQIVGLGIDQKIPHANIAVDYS